MDSKKAQIKVMTNKNGNCYGMITTKKNDKEWLKDHVWSTKKIVKQFDISIECGIWTGERMVSDMDS